MVSPLPGPAGNVEFFLHAVQGAGSSSLDVGSLVEEASLLKATR